MLAEYERSSSDSEAILAEGSSIVVTESTVLLRRHRSMGVDDRNPAKHPTRESFITRVDSTWLPSEDVHRSGRDYRRSVRRRIFLLLTEPSSSLGSLVFFTILIVTIALSNLLMILQTMRPWQFTPTDCVTCGGDVLYLFEDDDSAALDSLRADCMCPPAPKQYTVVFEDYLIYFFSIEWILRVVCFAPPSEEKADSFSGRVKQHVGYLLETTTILDFLAIFPYYMERFGSNVKGLLSLRLLRLFRVFQLVRLGQFNDTFRSLQNVLLSSIPYLRLLLVVLMFGSAFFGSMLYWLEKGEWKYWEETGDFKFIRLSVDGVTEEITPFTDIPQSFWWFMVTATTVGYGDMYPTSPGGKAIAILAMLTGVLVIAFPVSVFSDLWQKELKIEQIIVDEDEENEVVENGGNNDDGDRNKDADEDDDSNAVVEFSRKDAKALADHFNAIDSHQNKIRKIMKKYSIDA